MRRTIIGLLAAYGLAFGTTSHAIPTGDAVFFEIGSWELGGVVEQGVGNFAMMEAFIVSGSTFEDPGWGTLDAGWTAEVINPTYAKASGSDVTQQWLSNRFSTDVGVMVVWDVLVYNDNSLLETFRMWSNGSGWDVNNQTEGTASGGWSYPPEATVYNRERSAVPDGGMTIALLALSCTGLGYIRRERS